METIGKRLKNLREAKGLSQSSLAKLAGLKSQGTIGNIESESRGYGESIVDIARVLSTTPDYLRGETDDPATVLTMPAMTLTASANTVPADIGTRRIPLLDYVQAGICTEVAGRHDTDGVQDWLFTDLKLSSRSFALEITGDSMQPDFQPGDRIIIDPEVQPQPGDFVVAKNGEEETTFKKYRVRSITPNGATVFELVPLNTDFSTMRSDEVPICIVGTMVEHRKYRRKR